MYWSPNFLAVVFKKQEISHQILLLLGYTRPREPTIMSAEATRMQDLASEFSKKKFPGVIPRTPTTEGVH